MAVAAVLSDLVTGEWQVQYEGVPFATVATYRDATGIVVSTKLLGKTAGVRPYRFPDVSAADSFVRDLVTSFSYLGCQVAQA